MENGLRNDVVRYGDMPCMQADIKRRAWRWVPQSPRAAYMYLMVCISPHSEGRVPTTPLLPLTILHSAGRQLLVSTRSMAQHWTTLQFKCCETASNVRFVWPARSVHHAVTAVLRLPDSPATYPGSCTSTRPFKTASPTRPGRQAGPSGTLAARGCNGGGDSQVDHAWHGAPDGGERPIKLRVVLQPPACMAGPLSAT
jgi:hypothetical protein